MSNISIAGERAVCYKREYTFEANDEVQYEERSCVQDKNYIGKEWESGRWGDLPMGEREHGGGR